MAQDLIGFIGQEHQGLVHAAFDADLRRGSDGVDRPVHLQEQPGLVGANGGDAQLGGDGVAGPVVSEHPEHVEAAVFQANRDSHLPRLVDGDLLLEDPGLAAAVGAPVQGLQAQRGGVGAVVGPADLDLQVEGLAGEQGLLLGLQPDPVSLDGHHGGGVVDQILFGEPDLELDLLGLLVAAGLEREAHLAGGVGDAGLPGGLTGDHVSQDLAAGGRAALVAHPDGAGQLLAAEHHRAVEGHRDVVGAQAVGLHPEVAGEGMPALPAQDEAVMARVGGLVQLDLVMEHSVLVQLDLLVEQDRARGSLHRQVAGSSRLEGEPAVLLPLVAHDPRQVHGVPRAVDRAVGEQEAAGGGGGLRLPAGIAFQAGPGQVVAGNRQGVDFAHDLLVGELAQVDAVLAGLALQEHLLLVGDDQPCSPAHLVMFKVLGEGEGLAGTGLEHHSQVADQHGGGGFQIGGGEVEQVETRTLDRQGHLLLDALVLQIALHRDRPGLVGLAQGDVDVQDRLHVQAVAEEVLGLDSEHAHRDRFQVAGVPGDNRLLTRAEDLRFLHQQGFLLHQRDAGLALVPGLLVGLAGFYELRALLFQQPAGLQPARHRPVGLGELGGQGAQHLQGLLHLLGFLEAGSRQIQSLRRAGRGGIFGAEGRVQLGRFFPFFLPVGAIGALEKHVLDPRAGLKPVGLGGESGQVLLEHLGRLDEAPLSGQAGAQRVGGLRQVLLLAAFLEVGAQGVLGVHVPAQVVGGQADLQPGLLGLLVIGVGLDEAPQGLLPAHQVDAVLRLGHLVGPREQKGRVAGEARAGVLGQQVAQVAARLDRIARLVKGLAGPEQGLGPPGRLFIFLEERDQVGGRLGEAVLLEQAAPDFHLDLFRQLALFHYFQGRLVEALRRGGILGVLFLGLEVLVPQQDETLGDPLAALCGSQRGKRFREQPLGVFKAAPGGLALRQAEGGFLQEVGPFTGGFQHPPVSPLGVRVPLGQKERPALVEQGLGAPGQLAEDGDGLGNLAVGHGP